MSSTQTARPGLQAVLFDLGDTLLEFGPVDTLDLFEQGAYLTYDYLRSHGQPLPPFRKYHRRQLRAIHWAYFRSRLTRREFDSLRIIRRLSRRMDHELSEEQLEQLAWLWYEPLSRQAAVEPGLQQVLKCLRERGLTLGIVSNTFIPAVVLDRHLEREGVLDLLPVRIYSCDVGYRKPHPRIFRIALAQAEVAAEQTMFVGDSRRADVVGARRAGMVSVLKDPSGRHGHFRPAPHHVIRSLEELPPIVASYEHASPLPAAAD